MGPSTVIFFERGLFFGLLQSHSVFDYPKNKKSWPQRKGGHNCNVPRGVLRKRFEHRKYFTVTLATLQVPSHMTSLCIGRRPQTPLPSPSSEFHVCYEATIWLGTGAGRGVGGREAAGVAPGGGERYAGGVHPGGQGHPRPAAIRRGAARHCATGRARDVLGGGPPLRHGAVVGLRGRAPGKGVTITNIRAVAFGGLGDFERVRKMPSVEARPHSNARGGGLHKTSMPTLRRLIG